jgi:exo-1,4-beta-D-glucosaminidase
MGLNLLRWELKISSDRIFDLADEEGVPVMLGWMCCGQWESWDQWNAEDHRVAAESMRSLIEMLRSHASVFVWANGSDGLPPEPVRAAYNGTLKDLHWQNAVVDTVAAQRYKFDAATGRIQWNSPDQIEWSGIHMLGPYAWRPPAFWMSGRYPEARGACAEQGDVESMPPFESLKKFIPSDRLWPINDTWEVHAGMFNSRMRSIQLALEKRYGPSSNAEEFAKKAQLAHYENTRAQFEDFAANGWANHKMTIYWMMNSPWPSFFGHLYDYYSKPGGAYYGAKKGLRPLSVVFDSYALGDHSQANVTVVNQSPEDRRDLRVHVRIYDINGKLRQDKYVSGIAVSSNGAQHILSLPRMKDLTPVYFLRCELFDASGSRLAENVYWQSEKDDDVGQENHKDLLSMLSLKQDKWADMTALNTMTRVPLDLSASKMEVGAETRVTISLKNTTDSIAFFERVEIAATPDGDELLPILYDDNYVTVFPGETVKIHGVVQRSAGLASWIKLEGYNTAKQSAVIRPAR